MEKHTPEDKAPTNQDIESHNYNTPKDWDTTLGQEAEMVIGAREKIIQGAATLDIVEEGGQRYAIVKNILDNKIILKTNSPTQIDYLFGKTE